jgi:hypothetical protein
MTLTAGTGHVLWDYNLSDKAICELPYDATLDLDNLYNGAVGILIVYTNGHILTLPANSYPVPDDWTAIPLGTNQHYIYTFFHDGNKLSWKRTVANH